MDKIIYLVYYNAGPAACFQNKTKAQIYLNELRRADYKGARLVKMIVQ